MKIAYADPPYPGQAAKHYSRHTDYKGEVDHKALLWDLLCDYDGFCLHTASTTLDEVLGYLGGQGLTLAAAQLRVMAWVKPFAAFKANVPVAYAWEPVLVKAARKPTVGGPIVMRDFISEPITMQRGLAGAKPEAVCHWLFDVMGLEPHDDLKDLFPGTGAVGAAWETWRNQPRLPLDVIPEQTSLA